MRGAQARTACALDVEHGHIARMRHIVVQHYNIERGRRLLWDEDKGWYVNYKDGDFTEDNLSIDIPCPRPTAIG